MTRIYIPSRGAIDWKALLADPEKHWRAGFSAMTLAQCWEAANGLPPEIAAIFEQVNPSPELLLALPEHKVPLRGSHRGDSQSDIFALVRAGGKTVAITIEGKVSEPFDKPLGAWLVNAFQDKRDRLDFICDLLGLKQPLPSEVHYQLLQRTAAAVIEARRFRTDGATMIVHSFSPTGKWFDAFARFVALFGARPERDRLIPAGRDGTLPLFLGWASGDQRFLSIAT